MGGDAESGGPARHIARWVDGGRKDNNTLLAVRPEPGEDARDDNGVATSERDRALSSIMASAASGRGGPLAR